MSPRNVSVAALVFQVTVLAGCANAVATCDAETGIALGVTPAIITAGASATLTPTFLAGSGVITPGVGVVQSGASVAVQPASTTTYKLVVTDGSCTSTRTAGVTVVQPAEVDVTISPAAATVEQGGSFSFDATVVGPPNLSVNWSVLESNGGTVDAEGNYTAPNHSGTFHVVAASAVSPSSTAQATVTVPDVSVQLTPSSATLSQGAVQAFQAAVSGSIDTAVTWSVLESGGGSIDSNGNYTAPARAGTFHVVATSQAEPSVSAQAAVTVSAIAVSIAPAVVNVVVGGTQQFTATVSGSVNQGVNWSVVGSGGGSVTSGLYTASANTGTYHVVATSQGDPTKSASAAVTVVSVNVTISPLSATVNAGAVQAFTATVQGVADGSIDWSVQETNGGTIDSNGNYTASILSGTYHVIATSHAVPSATASAAVTVQNGLPPVPPLTNVTTLVHGDTVRVTFDPVDNAADYRIYIAPDAGDIVALGDGGTAIHNGTYRCAGEREAPGVPTDSEPQVPSGGVKTLVLSQVEGYTRTVSDEILGYVYVSSGPGLTPVWAMGNPATNADNACFFQRWTESRAKTYATSAAQHATLVSQSWRDDGVAFYVPAAGPATIPVYTCLASDSAPLYFSSTAELSARAGFSPTVAFPVLAAPAPGTQPLYRVYYQNACGLSHDELAVGFARYQRAVHQGLTPIPLVNWSGLSGPANLVIEALDNGCPFQGHLTPQAVDAGTAPGGSPHQAFLTLAQIRAADPMGEVFVGGEYDAGVGVRPNAIARTVVQVSPMPLEPMDFSDDFPADGGTIVPFVPTGSPGFQSVRYDSPAYDIEFYTMDLPFIAIGPMLGELWVSYADWASDTNGKFRLTPKQAATLSDSTFLHVMDEVDIVTTGRRYPQILVSTAGIPVQDNLPDGGTLLMQTFADWPPFVELEVCDHRTWDVNDQCPAFYLDKESQNPFSTDPLPPHFETGDLAGVDRRVRFDLYVSTGRAYVLVDGAPWACANLPAAGADGGPAAADAGTPNGLAPGPVSVTFGDVLYHSGVDVPDPPYTFHRAHMYTETRRHFDALGFKSGVPAPAWDETVLPCTSTFTQ